MTPQQAAIEDILDLMESRKAVIIHDSVLFELKLLAGQIDDYVAHMKLLRRIATLRYHRAKRQGTIKARVRRLYMKYPPVKKDIDLG